MYLPLSLAGSFSRRSLPSFHVAISPLLLIIFTLWHNLGAYTWAQESTSAPGTIYFVFGSDSSNPGIHIRTKTAYYRNTTFDLWRDPNRQTHRIFEPSFRNRYVDATGQPFRFTWWMQGGSLYRYATNTNVPYTSLMAIQWMRDLHQENLDRYGDEFTYHYHTWVWSDANGDGDYNWNQTPQYRDSRADFFKNLAEGLVEHDMFPVSFRSGWHFMDNDWQADLDDWMPYSLHNAYPANAAGTPEPVNNIYVWKDAPATWVPFRPRADNYQLPGGSRGWNTRSKHFRGVTEEMIRDIFEAADQGIDQVPCIWSHVAEATFIEDLVRVFDIIEKVAADYPHIVYRYDTAVEAMQRWRGTTDDVPPVLTVTELPEGDGIRLQVTSNEPLWQAQPFLGVRDAFGEHRRVDMVSTGPLAWTSTEVFTTRTGGHYAVAATDSAGNQVTWHGRTLPDDLVIDNTDDGFSTTGLWRRAPYSELDPVVGDDALVAMVEPGPSVSAHWRATVDVPAVYDVYLRIPDNPSRGLAGTPSTAHIPVSVWANGSRIFADTLHHPVLNDWVHLTATSLSAGDVVETILSSPPSGSGWLVADAVKLSAYRAPISLSTTRDELDLGQAVRGSAVNIRIPVSNRGFEPATISSIRAIHGNLSIPTSPIAVPAHQTVHIDASLSVSRFGAIRDTIQLTTDDPRFGVDGTLAIPVVVFGKGPFIIVDNEEDAYSEQGDWRTSVAQAYGASSRYVFITPNNATAKATYAFLAEERGWQVLSYLVPAAENSALRARYHATVNNDSVATWIVNQNAPASHWRPLGRIWTEPGDRVLVRVDLPDTDQAGRVLRTDAMQLESMGATLANTTVDNDMQDVYTETGEWSTSVSNDYFGTSSRYTFDGDAVATYTIDTFTPGLNELSIRLPRTENAATAALYRVTQNGLPIGDATINQNVDSGNWRAVSTFSTGSDAPLTITVAFADPQNPDGVLRTDALRWSFPASSTGTQADELALSADPQWYLYPNPVTQSGRLFLRGEERQPTLHHLSGGAVHTTVRIVDVLGRTVATIPLSGVNPGPLWEVSMDMQAFASGPYFLQIINGTRAKTLPFLVIP